VAQQHTQRKKEQRRGGDVGAALHAGLVGDQKNQAGRDPNRGTVSELSYGGRGSDALGPLKITSWRRKNDLSREPGSIRKLRKAAAESRAIAADVPALRKTAEELWASSMALIEFVEDAGLDQGDAEMAEE
jgi:hypothetical protein